MQLGIHILIVVSKTDSLAILVIPTPAAKFLSWDRKVNSHSLPAVLQTEVCTPNVTVTLSPTQHHIIHTYDTLSVT